jgi:hypothetical protein
MGGNIVMATNKITGLGDPTLAQDAATKNYVDTIATGINAHEAVSYASTAAVTGTYNNGVSGVGATLTGTGSLVIDGYTFVSGDAGTNVQGGTGIRVLLKDQALTDQNGIYALTACVSTTSWTLTRAYDYDAIGEVAAGDFTYVLNGTANSKFSFVETSKPTAISGVGTTANAIVFGIFANGNISGLVNPNQGGTGVNNGSNTITLGGTLQHAGAFAQIFRATAATDVTLPTTGTLATLAGTEALTNKTVNKLTITAPATGSTLTIADGKTLTASNTITLTATDGSTLAIGTGGTLGSAAFTATSAYLAAGVTSLPSVTSVNSTTIPNAATLLTSGGALGTPASGTLTNATGLPVSTGISGLGTGVATALAVAIGSTGAVVTNGGALGTPSAGTLTNATGLPISTGVSGLGTGIATFLATPTSANLRAAITDEAGTGALVFAGGDIGAATATTATAGNSSTLVATTAFVANAVSSSGTKKYTATNASITPSSGTATWSIPATTHLLGNTPAIMIQMYEVSSGQLVDADFKVDQTAGSAAPTGDVTVSWNASTTVAAATYRIVLIG